MSEGRPGFLIAGAYPLAALLLLLPVSYSAIRMWPVRPGEVAWRYGAFGMLMQSMALPVLAVALACVAAYLLGHHRVLRTLATLAVVGGGMIGLALVFFLLDAVRTRPMIAPDALQQFYVGTAWAAFAATLSAVVLVWIGVGVWRVYGEERPSLPREAAAERKRGTPAVIDRGFAPRPRKG